MRRRSLLLGLGAIGIVTAFGTALSALAQDTYPSRPIKIIAPVQPGGGVDLVARTIGDRLGPAIVKRLNDEINRLLESQDLRERLSSEALEPMPMSPDEFGRYIRDDIARWTRLAKERHIEIE